MVKYLDYLAPLSATVKAPMLAALILVCQLAPAHAAPKNIIVMIGDGMGQAHLSAYRHFQADGFGNAVRPTIFDQLLVGMSGTHPEGDNIITDSAAAGTALATGHKTCSQFVSLSCAGEPLRTVLQKAKAGQMRTGIVVSSQVTHATPAAYFAHEKSRHAQESIADQLVDNKVGDQLPVDVIFGGGTRYLIRQDRNLVEELKAAGYGYADSWQTLGQLQQSPALALLAAAGLPSALNNPVENPLAKLTEKALQLLRAGTEEDGGFFLMVEGSQIDWCGHANDIACTLAEMHDFAMAVQVAKAFVDEHPDTLLLVTSDHETGGLSLGDGQRGWRSDVLRGVQVTTARLADELAASDQWEELWLDRTGMTLSKTERKKLQAAREDNDDLLRAVRTLINRRSHTGWTSDGHTAVDVPVMAYGKNYERFRGYLDNAEIGRRLMDLIP